MSALTQADLETLEQAARLAEVACLIQFADGFRAVTSRNALRRFEHG